MHPSATSGRLNPSHFSDIGPANHKNAIIRSNFIYFRSLILSKAQSKCTAGQAGYSIHCLLVFQLCGYVSLDLTESNVKNEPIANISKCTTKHKDASWEVDLKVSSYKRV